MTLSIIALAGGKILSAQTNKTLTLTDKVTVSSDSVIPSGATLKITGTVYPEGNSSQAQTKTVDVAASDLKAGGTYDVKFDPIDISSYKDSGKSATYVCDITTSGADANGKNISALSSRYRGSSHDSEQVK